MVAPFSGRKVGGGLATLNQQLTEALAADGANDVRMLTPRLPAHSAADPSDHGEAQFVYLDDPKGDQRKLLSASEEDREEIYELLGKAAGEQSIKDVIGAGWVPDIIIGHSRFSGPAAVTLRNNWYPDARVAYFLHSYPVEGTLLTGDRKIADAKIKQEQEWMPQADVVLAVGPLLRAGAQQILSGVSGTHRARVHEFIGGTPLDPDPVTYLGVQPGKPRLELLMIGRASARIKGFEDLLVAVTQLEDLDVDLHVRIRGYANDPVEVMRAQEFVDGLMVSVPHVQEHGFKRMADGAYERQHHYINRVEVLELAQSTHVINADIRRSHAVLMPSYVEHFGLSPLEAAGHGVPILVNQMSGAGMFLADTSRFEEAIGDASVVRDLTFRPDRPLNVGEFLARTPVDVYDKRPEAWAAAIRQLADPSVLEQRFIMARKLYETLKGYSWAHCAKALVAAADPKWGKQPTVQVANGEVREAR
jgi:glycosyltransferase involved in cell wall biosynthesis